MVPFQKSDIVSIADGSLFVVFEKKLVKLRWYLRGAYPLKYREIPRVFAFAAPIDQPNVYLIAVGVHTEPAAVHKLLLFPASSAAMEYPNTRKLTFQDVLPTPSSSV